MPSKLPSHLTFRWLTSLLFLVWLTPAGLEADRGSELVDRLIVQVVENEQAFLHAMKDYQPLFETYIQDVRPGPAGTPVVVNDEYLIGRLDLTDGVKARNFALSSGFKKRAGFLFIKYTTKGLSAAGFAQMVLLDARDFNRETYSFDYVRRGFLGDVRCLVFDVTPNTPGDRGRFIGRVWVEDRGYRIVRFNGTYTDSGSKSAYFHFDSWRVNVAPNLWVPAYVYVEDRAKPGTKSGNQQRGQTFKAQTRLWGYNTGAVSRLQELTGILIESEEALEDESLVDEPSPVESLRSWERQAERNVIERLERSGLLARRGEVDEVLETVVNNLLISNDINAEIRCRLLLTTPLETFSIGRAIVISRGLVDVLPDEASLAMVLAQEVAHIALGHQTETMYAFADMTMFDDHELLARLRLERPPEDREAAQQKAAALLSRSPYRDTLQVAGLFLKTLEARRSGLRNLIEANLGSGLGENNDWAQAGEVIANAPELEEQSLHQIAALPLGSRTKVNPWTNEVALVATKPVVLRSASDKMPFELAPFDLHLTRMPDRTAERRDDTSPGGG